jgi:methionyl-tRNA formyltransferase
MSVNLKAPLPERPRIIFMGTPDFAVPSLESLIKSGIDIPAVVTQPDRPKGRGRAITASPVKELAVRHAIKVLQPERSSDPGFMTEIRSLAPDLIIVVAFGQILRKALLEVPLWGVINIHASLLPRHRGAAPIQRAIMEGDPFTGLTIMGVDEGLDTGPILYQRQVPIEKDETAGLLHDRLSAISGGFLMEFLGEMTAGRITETRQDPGIATYAAKIDRPMAKIDWGKGAGEISALIRGLDPFPGAFTLVNGNNVKLYSSTVQDDDLSVGAPGRVMETSGGILRIETGRGILGVREIQYPGKKRMPVKDFLRGFNLAEGTILGKE